MYAIMINDSIDAAGYIGLFIVQNASLEDIIGSLIDVETEKAGVSKCNALARVMSYGEPEEAIAARLCLIQKDGTVANYTPGAIQEPLTLEIMLNGAVTAGTASIKQIGEPKLSIPAHNYAGGDTAIHECRWRVDLKEIMKDLSKIVRAPGFQTAYPTTTETFFAAEVRAPSSAPIQVSIILDIEYQIHERNIGIPAPAKTKFRTRRA
jgi:hypothetical protein